MQLVKLDHSRLNQRRQCDGLVEAQRNVADAYLERIEEWVRPDVPPDLLGIVDAFSPDEQVDEILEVAPTGEGVRDIRARELIEDFASIGFQPGIHAQPEWRIR